MLELHRFLSEILRANITAIVWFIKFIGKRYRYIDSYIIRGAELKVRSQHLESKKRSDLGQGMQKGKAGERIRHPKEGT